MQGAAFRTLKLRLASSGLRSTGKTRAKSASLLDKPHFKVRKVRVPCKQPRSARAAGTQPWGTPAVTPGYLIKVRLDAIISARRPSTGRRAAPPAAPRPKKYQEVSPPAHSPSSPPKRSIRLPDTSTQAGPDAAYFALTSGAARRRRST